MKYDIISDGRKRLFENGRKMMQFWNEENRNSLIASASQGNANSQYELGRCYIKGLNGFEQDYDKAMNWFLKSAAQGNAYAQVELGRSYL